VSFGEHGEQILQTLVEIRDLLKHLVKADVMSQQFASQAPPPLPTQGQAVVRSPRDVSCPYCKSGVGQPCSSDQTELPVVHMGFPYHASRMRAVDLWPPRQGT
jgi:hypothetical protein